MRADLALTNPSSKNQTKPHQTRLAPLKSRRRPWVRYAISSFPPERGSFRKAEPRHLEGSAFCKLLDLGPARGNPVVDGTLCRKWLGRIHYEAKGGSKSMRESSRPAHHLMKSGLWLV